MSKIKELQIRFEVAILPLICTSIYKISEQQMAHLHTLRPSLYILPEMKDQSLLPQDKRSRGLFMCRFRGRNGVT